MRDTYAERAAGYGDELVIIASMLEKEAKTAEDMKLVAGIMQARREIGMPLQIDATVAYGCSRRNRRGAYSNLVAFVPFVIFTSGPSVIYVFFRCEGKDARLDTGAS